MSPPATNCHKQFPVHPEVVSPVVLKLASMTPQKFQGEVMRAKGRGGLRALLCSFDCGLPSVRMWGDLLRKGLCLEVQVLGSVDRKPSSTKEQRITKMNSV